MSVVQNKVERVCEGKSGQKFRVRIVEFRFGMVEQYFFLHKHVRVHKNLKVKIF